MYAIVEACGRQYQLTPGRFLDIDLVPYEAEQPYVFDKVLMIVNGKDSTVGLPYVEGAKVTGKVLSHEKGPKIIVYKMRSKKGTRKKQGHRQGYTRVMVEAIHLKDEVLHKVEHAARVKKEVKVAPSEKSVAKKEKVAAAPAKKTETKAPTKAPAKAKAEKATTEKAPAEKKTAAKPKAKEKKAE